MPDQSEQPSIPFVFAKETPFEIEYRYERDGEERSVLFAKLAVIDPGSSGLRCSHAEDHELCIEIARVASKIAGRSHRWPARGVVVTKSDQA